LELSIDLRTTAFPIFGLESMRHTSWHGNIGQAKRRRLKNGRWTYRQEEKSPE